MMPTFFQDERAASPGSGQNTVSLIVGGKTLYLFNLYDPENPIELAFQVGAILIVCCVFGYPCFFTSDHHCVFTSKIVCLKTIHILYR